MKYLSLDVETGGAKSSDTTLLTSAFIVYRETGSPEASLYLETKPDNNIPYRIFPEAIEINKINLLSHDEKALSYSEAGGKLYEFLKLYSKEGKEKLTPIGFGIHSDLERVYNLLKKNTFSNFTTYHKIEVGSVLKFMKDIGKLDSEAPESVEGLVIYFNLQNHMAHNAMSDAEAHFQIYEKLKELMNTTEHHEDHL